MVIDQTLEPITEPEFSINPSQAEFDRLIRQNITHQHIGRLQAQPAISALPCSTSALMRQIELIG